MNKRFINTLQKFRKDNAFDMQLDVQEGTTLGACGFDSLDRMAFVMCLEGEYGIKIDTSEIHGDTTVGQLCHIVNMLDARDGFIDLWLTSGTKWAKNNAEIDGKKLFTFDEAIEHFGEQMPTAVQLVELATECKHEWTERDGKPGMKFTGPNGNSIFFPADGYTWKGGSVEDDGEQGNVWSKTPSVNFSATYAYYLYFGSGDVNPLYNSNRAYGFSVRPVRE